MMANSRVKNTKRNIIAGFIKQILNIILPFITRTAILYLLGAEYQGLSGLFTSILQVLNLTDLGFTTAVVFILYKEIAANNTERICAITAFLRKVYLIIGLIILVVGGALMPLLPYLISGSYPDNINLYIFFAIYLFNTVISYMLFAYKSAIFTAMQRNDIVSNIYSITSSGIKVIQFALLLIFHNYYVYIIVMPIGTILNNVLLQVFSRKYFPQIIPKGKIDVETRKVLGKQVKAIFIGKVGDVARNSFDNIVLSSLIGLTMVAIYDNYYYIYSALYGMMLVITHAIQASVGNSVATESVEKNYNDFLKFNFIFMWIVGWCTVCMFCLYQPFMIIWMRGNQELLLSFLNMTLFCVYFYAINMNNMRNMYVNANGLYWENRLWFILEAISNLALNFLLGYFFGVTGIIVATIVTIVVFNFITRNNVLFKHYFKCSQKKFYLQHLFYIMITVANCALTWFICSIIPLEGIVGLIVKMILCLFVPNALYLLVYFKYPMFKTSFSFMKGVLLGRFKKKKVAASDNNTIITDEVSEKNDNDEE